MIIVLTIFSIKTTILYIENFIYRQNSYYGRQCIFPKRSLTAYTGRSVWKFDMTTNTRLFPNLLVLLKNSLCNQASFVFDSIKIDLLIAELENAPSVSDVASFCCSPELPRSCFLFLTRRKKALQLMALRPLLWLQDSGQKLENHVTRIRRRTWRWNEKAKENRSLFDFGEVSYTLSSRHFGLWGHMACARGGLMTDLPLCRSGDPLPSGHTFPQSQMDAHCASTASSAGGRRAGGRRSVPGAGRSWALLARSLSRGRAAEMARERKGRAWKLDYQSGAIRLGRPDSRIIPHLEAATRALRRPEIFGESRCGFSKGSF